MPTLPAAPMRAVEVEVCAPQSRQLFFSPVGKTVRGRVDFAHVKSKAELSLRDTWPDPIPGKIIGINEAGEKYIREPLHDSENTKLRMLIQSRGMVLEDERETFAGESIITWLYWLRRAVDAGLARILKGELPPIEELEPARKRKLHDERLPMKDFIFAPAEESPLDRMAAAMELLAANTAANTAIMQKVLEKLGK